MADLTKEQRDFIWTEFNEDPDDLAATLKRAGRCIRPISEPAPGVGELVAALEPFAALADEVDRLRHEDDSTCPHRLRAGDLRRARTALAAYRGQADG